MTARLFLIILLLLACTCLVPCSTAALDRCASFRQEVRRASNRYLGLEYPWWYSLGQLKQESGCREGITAFDGGQGLAQFMPGTEAEVERTLGSPLDMYRATDAIKAQAWYLSRLHKQNPDGRLCYTFMFYNSGAGTVKAEARRSGCDPCHWDYEAMRAACKRKVLTLKNGAKLDLCNVGYDYPVKIQRYGDQYRTSPDRWRYW